MIRRSRNGLVFYQFESLTPQHEILHAVFTRIGGSSEGPFRSLNVGQLVGDSPQAVRKNHELVVTCLGIQAKRVVTARQVHGAHAAVVGPDQHGMILPSTDALLTRSQDTYLLMRFADCLPLILYDPVHRAVALVHCGWRGLLAGIVPNAVQKLQRAFGSQPGETLAALGPAIGPCCYEIGPDVVQGVRQVFGPTDELLHRQPDGRVHFDLPGAVRVQLSLLGLDHIEDSGVCTACRTDEFFSHRAERGHTGRFAALIGLHGTAMHLGTR